MNKLHILSREKQTYLQLLHDARLPNLTVTDDPSEANILLADPPKAANKLEHYPELKWLQSTFAGIDALTTATQRKDYQLTNVRGIFGPLIAEYVIAHLVSYYRNFPRYAEQQRDGLWQPSSYPSLQGKRLLILGTGSIGTYLAHVCKVMGMKVSGVNRSGIVHSRDFKQIYRFEQLPEALEQADVIVSTLPATPETDSMLNQDTLQHCRGALLFNVGRGGCLSESGLISALEGQFIQHAWLDVFKQEPLDRAHPFWQHPAITVTPHIAAESFPEQVFNIFAHNYLRWVANEPLDCVIDFDKGY